MTQRIWIGVLVVLTGLGTASAPATADSSVRFRLGQFTPDGESEYWEGKEIDFTGEAEDLEGVFGGLDFLFEPADFVGLIVSVDRFENDMDQEYREFVDAAGNPIVHETNLEITPLTVGVLVRLAPPRSPVRPYLGAGAGLYLWRLEERGEFIDFITDPPQIFDGEFTDEGEPFGYYLMAGIEVPVGPYFSFFAQGRWDEADDELENDFAGLGELDLSGRRLAAGISWRF